MTSPTSASEPRPTPDTDPVEAPDEVAYLSAFGSRLRQLRILRSLTQDDLAAAVGLSRSTLSQIESGNASIGLLRILALTQALHVSVVDLLPDVGPPNHVDDGGSTGTLDTKADDEHAEQLLRTAVGRRARSQRTWLGLTQDEVATRAGLTRNFISAVERGQYTLDAHRLLHHARALNTTLGWLLNDPNYHRFTRPFDS